MCLQNTNIKVDDGNSFTCTDLAIQDGNRILLHNTKKDGLQAYFGLQAQESNK